MKFRVTSEMYLTGFCLVNLIVSFNIYTASGRCQPDGEKVCWPGFYFNEIFKDCRACPLGYIGLNCSIPCRYPSYGNSCQNVCICREEFCDRSAGCKNSKDIRNIPSSSSFICSVVRLPIPKDLNGVIEERSYPIRKMTDLKQRDNLHPIPKQSKHPTKKTINDPKSAKPNESKSESQTTPILIGVVVALCLILLAVGFKFIWKYVKNSYLKNRREDTDMSNIKVELKRITCEYEDMKENLYEDLDEKESRDSKDKKKESNTENDHIDTLKIIQIGGNKNEDRESKHFYDALK